jgi:TatD DNase family protein
MLVDSHCHLNFPQFADDLDGVVARAIASDVRMMQTISTSMKELGDILAIAEAYPHIYASAGVHPNNVSEEPLVTLEELIKAASHPKIIGIGETGLDFYYEHSPQKKQEESFRIHLQAAADTGLPVIVHTRDADQRTIDILRECYAKAPFTGLIHCFSTSYDLAEAAMELGMYISISGIVTFKKAIELQEHVTKIPLERLLVETDAPYLAPTPHRGKTNEPAYTKLTAQAVAALKDVSYEAVATQTTENFFTLFTKADKAMAA